MNDKLKAPQSSTGDVVHRAASVTTAFLPGWEGILANQLIGLLTPPLQQRQQEFMEQVAMRINALEATGVLEVTQLGANEGFLSVLVQAARVATHNHRKEKLRMLQDAILSVARYPTEGADLHQLYVRYIDELSPEHVLLLAFLHENNDRDWVRHVSNYEALHQKAAEGMGFNYGKELFALWCEDLKGRWLIRVSREVDEFPGVHSRVLRATSGESPGPRVLVTNIGRDFLEFLNRGRLGR